MEWLQRAWPGLVGFLLSPATLLGLTLFSAVAFVVSVVGASWMVRRMPVDYLLRPPQRARRSGVPSVGLVLRNALGALLLILGALMLVLPGQGVLTILAGFSLMDFRGKRRLERRLMLQPRVLAAINRLRGRLGRPPLLSVPPGAASAADEDPPR